jgi:hypothetical protein
LGVLQITANIMKGKKNSILIIILALLLFTIGGCKQDHIDKDMENIDPGPDYSRTATADTLSNNLMNAGYIVGYGDTTLFTLRKGDKAVYKDSLQNSPLWGNIYPHL